MKSRAFAVVLPYYNELGYIRTTLESCLAQHRLPDQLILVDNASTDGSTQLCQEILRDAPPQMEVVYVHESKPGYINAVNAGFAKVACEYTAIWNADTYYPPHYFQACEGLLFEHPQTVAALALDIEPRTWGGWFHNLVYSGLGAIRRQMGFTGGFGHVFRTQALRDSGGYSLEIWPYAMDDHEILDRVCRYGRLAYSPNHWCLPSDRRQDRRAVSWNLWERIVYFLTPASKGTWYFHTFLGPRLKQRKIFLANLRERDWEQKQPANKAA